MWSFRSYARGDIDAMFELDELCFTPPFRFSRREMQRFAEAPNAHVVLAETEDVLAGFCIVHAEVVQAEKVGYIVTLDVRPTFRRRGLAQQLMQRAEAHAGAAGCRWMALHVFTGNPQAIRFYGRIGYTRIGLANGFYGHDKAGQAIDAFVYRKTLHDPD